MTTNPIALAFVQEHEGCKLVAYRDSAGNPTIGYGATGPDIHLGMTWTQEEADARLASDLGKTEQAVSDILSRNGITWLSEAQKAAVISFAYNLGANALAKSQLLEALKQGHELDAAKEFVRWDHAGGKEVKGLLIRRLEEAALFLRG